MIFKVHCKFEAELINQTLSYIFKDYNGFSQWKKDCIWCHCFDSNNYNYFYWKGSQEKT